VDHGPLPHISAGDVLQRTRNVLDYDQSNFLLHIIFKPPPPVGAGGGYVFSGRASVRPSIRYSRGSFMFP